MKLRLTDRVVWQQACGDRNRDYRDICINWGVILNGPGEFGPWPECIGDMQEDRTPRKVTDIKRFCEEIKSGHLVVLKLGINTVIAVGEVVGDYVWSDSFGDIDGWDLEHVRRVRWFWSDTQNPKVFDSHSVKFGDTTQRLLQTGKVWDWLLELEIPEISFTSELRPFPFQWDFKTSIKDVAEHLYGKGVTGNSINALLSEFDELVRIANWYGKSGNSPSERETVAYLVIPLLRALGWSPQRMAIEWSKVDIALFNGLPRKNDNLSVVVECKQMNASCLTAMSQAENYANTKPNCTRLIVTDGIRYGVYLKKEDRFQLNSYLNLSRLRSEYPVYAAHGIQDAFYVMSPDFRLEEHVLS